MFHYEKWIHKSINHCNCDLSLDSDDECVSFSDRMSLISSNSSISNNNNREAIVICHNNNNNIIIIIVNKKYLVSSIF